jgi:hypothetical protein
VESATVFEWETEAVRDHPDAPIAWPTLLPLWFSALERVAECESRLTDLVVGWRRNNCRLLPIRLHPLHRPIQHRLNVCLEFVPRALIEARRSDGYARRRRGLKLLLLLLPSLR